MRLVDHAGNAWGYTPDDLSDHGWPSRVTARATDHRVPTADAPSDPIPVGSDVPVSFNEEVNGINDTSAILLRDPFSDSPVLLPGTWTCTTATDADTDCATGEVREATFDPASDLDAATAYAIVLNPEHRLSVTDLAGNPFDRWYVSFSTE